MSLLHPGAPLLRGLPHLLLLVFLITGCTEGENPVRGMKETKEVSRKAVPIGQILKRPDLFLDRPVTIRGTAHAGLAFEFVDEQPYRLQDNTGSIWVITRGTMPREGSTVVVTGRVVSPYQIKGRRYEIAILEDRRQ